MAKIKAPNIWNVYKIRWHFLTSLCGSIPANPDLIAKWQESRAPKKKPMDGMSIEEITQEVLEHAPEADEEECSYSILQFQRDDGHLAMRYGTIRAHLKDCARVISAQFVPRVKGKRAFSTRVINGVYVDESVYWVPILRADGKPITESDGYKDKAAHVRGPRGEPLNALKRIEYIDPPSMMEFTIKILGNSITETDLHLLMTYGGTHGYAGERGDGEGRYRFEIEKTATADRGGAAN